MNKFRVNKPVSDIKNRQDDLQRFSSDAERHEINAISIERDKPNKSFTIPLNEYELDLLRSAAKVDNRSQRYIARLLLVQALKAYLKKEQELDE